MVMNVMVLLVERPSGLLSEQPPLWDLTSTQLVPTASMGMNILFTERPSELPSEQKDAHTTTKDNSSTPASEAQCPQNHPSIPISVTFPRCLPDLPRKQLARRGPHLVYPRPDRMLRPKVLRLTKATASGSSLPKTLPISVNGLTSSIHPTTSAIYSSAPSAPGPRRVTMYPIHQSMRSEVPTRYIRDRIERFTPSMYQVLRLTKATASGSSLPKTLPISVHGLTSPTLPTTSAIYSSAPSAPEPRRVTMYPIHQFMRCSMVPQLALGSLKYSSGCSQSGLTAPHTMTGPTYRRYENQTGVVSLRFKSSHIEWSGRGQKNMPSQKKLSLPSGEIDTRTPQQKAADTRKANKAAEERKARELQDSLTPRRAKQAAIQAWQPVTGQKRKCSRKEGSNAGSDLDAKRTKTKKTEERFLAPIMEGSDDDFTVASKSKPSPEPTRSQQDTKSICESEEDVFVRPPARKVPDGVYEYTNTLPMVGTDHTDVLMTKGVKRGARVGHKSPQRRIVDDSSSSDQESQSHAGDSPSRLSHMEDVCDSELDVGDGELIDVDDDNDLDGKDASALGDLFRAEQPSWASSKGAAALFDNDDDVIGIGDAAPAKAQHQSHQNASMLFSDSDLDKTPQPKQGPATCKPVGSLPPQGRPRQASEPKPQWDEPKHRIKDEQTDKPIPPASKQWPLEACVVYPTSGDIKLTDQHSDLARVIRGAMQALTKYALWTNAYPPIESHTKLTQQWLYAAAKERKAKIIKMRVKEDTRFVRSLQDLIFARIGTLRSSLKDSAVKAVTGGYGLNGNDYQKVAKHVEGWLTDDNYIFPQRDNIIYNDGAAGKDARLWQPIPPPGNHLYPSR
ncbi:hypothetical protein BJV78DRAFT_1339585 [Lactifluus subvellereus]|nr:hypothetical protein BJV78DRAFT_1339585 [Lactifluus subvellereus]